MSLQAINHQQQLKELQADINELRAENQKLQDQIDEQNQKFSKILRSPSMSSKLEAASPKAWTNRDPSIAPVLIVFDDFQQHTIWWSPPFYTHHGGYKMCLRVFPNGNRSGENTHISVYINILKGE